MANERITEAQVETQINKRLQNLGWNLDYNSSACDVYKQTVKTKQEKKELGGKKPDYVLYGKNGKPLAIIEVKRPNKDINQALRQGIDYAKRLKAPIVFASTGSYTTSWHVAHNRPLELNKSEVKELISPSIASHYLDNYVHLTEDKKVIKSKEELLTIFRSLNNHFKEAGITAGRPRIELFCNFLFLKLISELTEQKANIIQPIPDWAKWKTFTKKHQGESLFNFINKTAYEHFKKAYGGEVLSPIKINAGKDKNRHVHKKATYSQGKSTKGKIVVLGMLEGKGKVIVEPVENVSIRTLTYEITKHIDQTASVYTDEWLGHNNLKRVYNHQIVKHHEGEYVKRPVHTNTIEGFWSILKRGIISIYRYTSKKHLRRYLDEFSCRYNKKIFLKKKDLLSPCICFNAKENYLIQN